MLVPCPDCGRSYHLDAQDIGVGGRIVICSRCDARWFQEGERPATLGASEIPLGSVELRPEDAPRQNEPPVPFRARVDLRSFLMPACLALCAVLSISIVAKRDLVVRTVPRVAALYARAGLRVNVRGLDFRHVASSERTTGEVTIGGEIRNVAGRRTAIPRIAFEIRDAANSPLLTWSETPPAATLGAGYAVAFASKPHRLPPNSRTALVRFETDGDGQVDLASR